MPQPPISSQHAQGLKPRKIIGINRTGLYTLIKREVGRFAAVYMQTIVAPVITTLLFYAIFALAFGGIARTIGQVPFLEFLAPGLIMMAMVQNAFANTSSSIVIAKFQGSIVDVVMPPLSNMEFFTGFVMGGVIRGLAVGLVTGIAVSIFAPFNVVSPMVVVIYAVLGNVMMSALGLIAGIWSEKFDHIAAVTNFIITPLTFLSGTFYSVESLPEMWHKIALYNPFFYLIDGFRSGFIGQADGAITIGISILVIMNIALAGLALQMLRTGYKMKT